MAVVMKTDMNRDTANWEQECSENHLYMSRLLSISVQLWSMSIPDSDRSSKRRLQITTEMAGMKN